MITHRHSPAWLDQLEDVYDDSETGEPWFKKVEMEGDDLFQADESSLYLLHPSGPRTTRSASERKP